MYNLLYKEFKLAVHPMSFIFLSLGAMLLIPSYPYYVAFFYQTLGIFFTFMAGNATNDIYFTALLPIKKWDAVRARLITVISFELLQIIVSIPFAFLRKSIIPFENSAGMEANVALFGIVFVMYGIFNIVFLPMFYKTAYKTGLPFLISCTAMFFFIGAAEATIQLVPVLRTVLDTINPAYLLQQTEVLLVGIVLFAGLTAWAYLSSARNFERVDL
jgi:hypothetical protein